MPIPFALVAKQIFDVIAQRFDLSCVLANEREVRYENDEVIMTVRFDNGGSYELEIEVGRLKSAQPERLFSLAEVLRLRDVAEAASIDGMMVSDAAQLPDALRRLAELTSRYATDFLMGSDLSFAQVAEQRQRESDAYVLERALQAARTRSEVAWKKRDYYEVVRSLEPLELHLSPAERKRLDYSRRHVAS